MTTSVSSPLLRSDAQVGDPAADGASVQVPDVTPPAPALPRLPALPVGGGSAFAARLADLEARGLTGGEPAGASDATSAGALGASARTAVTLGAMLRAGAPVRSPLGPAGLAGTLGASGAGPAAPLAQLFGGASGPFSGHAATVAPVAGPVSSTFGPRVHPISGERRQHDGIDYAAPTGTPVRTVTDGTVVAAGERGGYGLLVEVDHGNGTTTRYAHLSAIDVAVGDRLDVGQVLGAVGSTGNSTGPHLHVEVRVDGEAVDPDGMW